MNNTPPENPDQPASALALSIAQRIDRLEREVAALRLKAATIRHHEELELAQSRRELGITQSSSPQSEISNLKSEIAEPGLPPLAEGLKRQQLAEAPQPDASEDEPVLDPDYEDFLARRANAGRLSRSHQTQPIAA